MEQGLNRFTLRIALLGVLSALPATPAVSSPTSTIAQLPNVQMNAAKVDGSGNIYLAGQTTSSSGSGAAYIAKLNPGGTILYAVTLGGSGSSTSAATALDVDSTGSVYVAGTTTASNLPVTAGAVQTPGGTAFGAKLDADGNVLYSALIGGNANTRPGSIVVNSKKELAVSGQSTTQPSGAVALFLLKLSADGTQVVSGPQGIGGLLAIDSQDNIYVAGDPPAGTNGPPATPGAFQVAPAISYYGCPFLSFPSAGDQFVASLTPDLSGTRFLTYVTAHYGAVPASIAVDAQGNVLIAGTTYAPAYPTTSGSYEPNYSAFAETVLTCGPPVPMEVTSASGYVTLVKADGSGLIFSTFFSGTKSDHLSFAALTSAGIYLAGQAGSVDLPGFNGAVPPPCVPVGFVTGMTLDGSAISSSRTPPGTPLVYDSTTGTLLLAAGSQLLRFDPSQPTPIACVLDAADLSPLTAVAPGELLTMFGRFQYFETQPFEVAITPENGAFPTSSQGLSIVASQAVSASLGLLAPLLYVWEPQINFQLPYKLAAASQANVTVAYSDVNGNSVSDSRTLEVVASNPVALLSQPSIINEGFPVALNSDGAVNSQTNPAAAGSVVTLFLDGLGLTNPLLVAGQLNTAPSAPLSFPVVVTADCSAVCSPAPAFVSAGSLVGSISGVTQVQLRAPANPRPGSAFLTIFSLSVGPTAVRDMNLSLWAK